MSRLVAFPSLSWISVCFACYILVGLFQGTLTQGNFTWDSKNTKKKELPWSLIQEARERMVLEDPLVESLVECMADQASMNTNTCVSSLVLNFNTSTPSTDPFSIQFKNKSMMACEPQCESMYRDNMMKITEKCVTEMSDQLKKVPSMNGDITMLSKAIREVGNSLVGYVKESTCLKSNSSTPPTLCMAELSDLIVQNKNVTATPMSFKKPVFLSLSGMKVMYNDLDVMKLETLGSKALCTTCHLRFLETTETFFAKQVYPMLSSMMSNHLSRSMMDYSQFINHTNQVCGMNALVPKLNLTTSTGRNSTSKWTTSDAFKERPWMSLTPLFMVTTNAVHLLGLVGMALVLSFV